ncbi:MAG TPA: Hsp20/alpha crystallin family protein [Candidatus Melainabacteria bacterium]|nr:Hsp20/alpha crystallin family protein [Candidatus Melainabacteria bacterium]HIN63102.1 Hsp20/alpha crystallin family protein [Candidatus Obscuribacterales bacterium]
MTTATPVKEEKAKETKKESTAIARREHPFLALQEEMNHLFEEFKGGLPFGRNRWFEPMSEFSAKVDMKDDDKVIVVSAELPGVEMKDIEVKVEDRSLVIKGEKRSEKEEKDKNYYRMERSYGSFYRLLPLPTAVEKSAVEAVYKDGVLKVTLPKSKEAIENGKTIPVKAG